MQQHGTVSVFAASSIILQDHHEMYTECPICIPLSVLLEADGCIASMECAASSSKRATQLNEF